MDNKSDWEKLEKWNANRIQLEKQKRGFYAEDSSIKEQNKKVDNFIKVLKITGKISKTFIIISFIIITLAIIIVFDLIFSNMNARTNVKPKKTIENMYNVKIELVSKDVDEKENGKYVFQVSDNNEIQFTAIRKFGNLSEDYSDNCHKYYFEKWESKEKKKFTINETINSNILDYDTYIRINSYEELENAMDIINNFVNYCGNNFNANWRIYLKKGDYTIYPYNQNGMSNEEATNNAKELWNKYFK